jgi:formylmethanofuran dehydrogenase subunit D
MEIKNFLKYINLEYLHEKFEENFVDEYEVLKSMTRDEFIEIGLKIGELNRIIFFLHNNIEIINENTFSLSRWLKDIKKDEYTNLFLENEIKTLFDLSLLNKDDLKALNIKVGHRIKIINEIKEVVKRNKEIKEEETDVSTNISTIIEDDKTPTNEEEIKVFEENLEKTKDERITEMIDELVDSNEELKGLRALRKNNHKKLYPKEETPLPKVEEYYKIKNLKPIDIISIEKTYLLKELKKLTEEKFQEKINEITKEYILYESALKQYMNENRRLTLKVDDNNLNFGLRDIQKKHKSIKLEKIITNLKNFTKEIDDCEKNRESKEKTEIKTEKSFDQSKPSITKNIAIIKNKKSKSFESFKLSQSLGSEDSISIPIKNKFVNSNDSSDSVSEDDFIQGDFINEKKNLKVLKKIKNNVNYSLNEKQKNIILNIISDEKISVNSENSDNNFEIDKNISSDDFDDLWIDSCVEGNLFHLHKLFNFGVDMNLLNINKKFIKHNLKTSLHLSISKLNNIHIIEFLLSKNADPNLEDDIGSIPLHVSALKGYLDVSILLLSSGSDPNFRDSYGNTPLHLSLKGRYYDISDSLLLFGSDINYKKFNGYTCLHECAIHSILLLTKMM